MFIDITMFKTVPSAGAEHRNILHTSCLQCFGTVGWASGRASGRKKLSCEVLAWLSVWSEVQMQMVQLIPLRLCHLLLH